MDRRTFLKTGAALPLAAYGWPRVAAALERAGWRTFEVTTQLQILEPAGVARAWVPVPLVADTDYFRNLGSTWTAHEGDARSLVESAYKTGMVTAQFRDGAPQPTLTVVSRFATRDRAVDLSKRGSAQPEDPAVLKLALESTDLIPTDGIVRDTARSITRWKWGDVSKAEAIYQWIVENTYRDPKVKGCGWGDIKAMLETHNLGGKCGDLNALFVGLARSVGIPARDVYGVRVAKSRLGYVSLGANTPNISKAQHCRAEFYAEGYGWIPVDPADVRKVALEEPPGHLALSSDKVAAARKRLFGSWEMNWLAYNYAHDVKLPGSSGPVIPYLMYPNGETAKGRLDSLDPDTFKYAITSREITRT
jgi:transglutaminase-like putative cysteine protease